MRSLTIEGKRPDGLKGYIRVKVEPSTRIHSGVSFSVNDHYEVEDPKTVLGSETIINFFERSWGDSLRRSESFIDALLENQ